MSTKNTLASGGPHNEGFHFYTDFFEPGKIYLEMTGVEFMAWQGGVTVAIPVEIWEKIRLVSLEGRTVWVHPEDPGEDPAISEEG